MVTRVPALYSYTNGHAVPYKPSIHFLNRPVADMPGEMPISIGIPYVIGRRCCEASFVTRALGWLGVIAYVRSRYAAVTLRWDKGGRCAGRRKGAGRGWQRE